MPESNSENRAISKILVPGLHQVYKAQGPDERLYFKDLRGDETPLEELPKDELTDIYYRTMYSQHCSICNSPYRVLLEHVYIANGDSIQSVRHFFMRYYGARITHQTIQKHMDFHCDLREIKGSGLRMLAKANDEIDMWSGRPTELALKAVMKQIDDIQGLRIKNNPELDMKRSAVMRQLTDQLIKVSAAHNEAMSNDFDTKSILSECVHALSEHPQAQQVLLAKIREIHARVSRGKAQSAT